MKLISKIKTLLGMKNWYEWGRKDKDHVTTYGTLMRAAPPVIGPLIKGVKHPTDLLSIHERYTSCAYKIKTKWPSTTKNELVVFIPITTHPSEYQRAPGISIQDSRYKGVTVDKIQKWVEFLNGCDIKMKVDLDTKILLDQKLGLPVTIPINQFGSSQALLAAVEALRYCYSPNYSKACKWAYTFRDKYKLSNIDSLMYCTSGFMPETNPTTDYNAVISRGCLPYSNIKENFISMPQGTIHSSTGRQPLHDQFYLVSKTGDGNKIREVSRLQLSVCNILNKLGKKKDKTKFLEEAEKYRINSDDSTWKN